MSRRWTVQARRAMVQPGYLASIVLLLLGLALDIVGNTHPYPYSPLAIFGPIVVALGVGVGMIQGGLAVYPYLLVVVPAVIAIFLIAVGRYDFLGAQSWGL